MTVPDALEWKVHPFPGPKGVEPLHSHWRPLLGPGTLPAIALAVLGVAYAPRLAERLSWGRLLLAAFAVGWLWLVSLALIEGVDGLGAILGERFEYFREARNTDDVPLLLREWVDRIPRDHPDNLAANVAGHPAFLFLFFVLLERLGLDAPPASGLIVITIAATAPVAVLIAARRLAGDRYARLAAPYLVLTPMALWIGVSADSLVMAVGAWGLALLAHAATTRGRAMAGWSVCAGLLLGSAVMMSYGAILLGFVALAVLLAARSWWPMAIAAATACIPVMAVLGPFGYHWIPAYLALEDRYWIGIARMRPPEYWMWGNLGALLLATGLAMAAGLGALIATLAMRRRRQGSPGRRGRWGRWLDLLDDGAGHAVVGGGPLPEAAARTRAAVLLPLAGLACVTVANLSLMSLSEVERIWLPFMPWMVLATAFLPRSWMTRMLAAQVLLALVLDHLLNTHW